MQNRLPFEVTKQDNFYERLGDWIGDCFYDILPEAGFETRDEQIYMAFQLENAFKDNKVIFAEAGVGTGKTIVYLLYAIAYARYKNKPAIIACADETLIEQLVKKEGDIAKLEQALNLNVDVRLAKSRDQYLCIKKLEDEIVTTDDKEINEVYDNLPDFVHGAGSMTSFSRYGDRKEYPHLTDEQWDLISWDSFQDCFTCDLRHRCGQTLNRDYYRNSKDLIICSHDFYMEHIWTKESRKREGQLPFLPESSCVIFDEGHLLEFACQKALTYRFTEQILENLLKRLMNNDVREKTLNIIEDILDFNEFFFDTLEDNSTASFGSDKRTIDKNEKVLKIGRKLQGLISDLEEELVFEGELYMIDEYDLKIVEEYLEQITYSLSLFLKDLKGITWFEDNFSERTLVIMPRLVEDIMAEEVFSQNIPIVFPSATLSENKSFDYIAKSLGVKNYLSMTVASPFDYDENMEIYMPKFESDEAKQAYIFNEIEKKEGKSLVLFNSREDLESYKEYASNKTSLTYYFEGDAEVSTLVSHFQNEVNSVLCAVNLWEGLDVPGESLENVFIYSLPYPPNDPVFAAKRESVTNAFEEVDLPYMLLRLRQGIGRLIRTHEDKGTVHICLNENTTEQVIQKVTSVLPTEVK